jgi:hypothetical protein
MVIKWRSRRSGKCVTLEISQWILALRKRRCISWQWIFQGGQQNGICYLCAFSHKFESFHVSSFNFLPSNHRLGILSSSMYSHITDESFTLHIRKFSFYKKRMASRSTKCSLGTKARSHRAYTMQILSGLSTLHYRLEKLPFMTSVILFTPGALFV